jgi:hypothetical protein
MLLWLHENYAPTLAGNVVALARTAITYYLGHANTEHQFHPIHQIMSSHRQLMEFMLLQRWLQIKFLILDLIQKDAT